MHDVVCSTSTLFTLLMSMPGTERESSITQRAPTFIIICMGVVNQAYYIYIDGKSIGEETSRITQMLHRLNSWVLEFGISFVSHAQCPLVINRLLQAPL